MTTSSKNLATTCLSSSRSVPFQIAGAAPRPQAYSYRRIDLQVLAIRKALSIQAHPDKKLAEKLHAEKPDVYKGELSQCPVVKQPMLTASHTPSH